MVRLVHCPENSYRKTLLCECVNAYLPVEEEQRRQFETMLRHHPDSGVQTMTLGLLDHVEQRGKLAGKRETIREQFTIRFGPLSPEVLDRLENWQPDRLNELVRAVISATALQELGLVAPIGAEDGLNQ